MTVCAPTRLYPQDPPSSTFPPIPRPSHPLPFASRPCPAPSLSSHIIALRAFPSVPFPSCHCVPMCPCIVIIVVCLCVAGLRRGCTVRPVREHDSSVPNKCLRGLRGQRRSCDCCLTVALAVSQLRLSGCRACDSCLTIGVATPC